MKPSAATFTAREERDHGPSRVACRRALLALRAQPLERGFAEHADAPSARSEAFAEDLCGRVPEQRTSLPVLLLALAPLVCALAGAVFTPLFVAG